MRWMAQKGAVLNFFVVVFRPHGDHCRSDDHGQEDESENEIVNQGCLQGVGYL